MVEEIGRNEEEGKHQDSSVWERRQEYRRNREMRADSREQRAKSRAKRAERKG